jgi:hypothetical protein
MIGGTAMSGFGLRGPFEAAHPLGTNVPFMHQAQDEVASEPGIRCARNLPPSCSHKRTACPLKACSYFCAFIGHLLWVSVYPHSGVHKMGSISIGLIVEVDFCTELSICQTVQIRCNIEKYL